MLKLIAVVHLSCFLILFQLSWQQITGDGSFSDPTDDPQYTDDPSSTGDNNSPDVPRIQYVRLRSRVRSQFPDAGRKGNADPSVTVSPELLRLHHNRQRLKNARIMQIILDVKDMTGINDTLGFKKSPMTQGLEAFQKRLVESHNTDLKNDDANPNERVLHTILLPSCQNTDSGNSSKKDFVLFFNIGPSERILKPESIVVKSADLLLKRRSLRDTQLMRHLKATEDRKSKKRNKNYSIDNVNNWKVRLHSYSRSKKGNKKALKSVPLNPYNSTEWLKIGLLKVVDDWYTTPVRNPGLQVTVVDGRGKPVNPFHVFHDFNCDFPEPSLTAAHETTEAEQGVTEDREDNQNDNASPSDDSISNFPHLEVVTVATPSSANRSQRHLAKRGKTCRKRTVYVKFRDLGPEWEQKFYAPTEFKSAVCEGRCGQCVQPKPLTGFANMTQVQFGKKGTDTCCRPTETEPLNVLVLRENGKYEVDTLRHAVVTKCGCSRSWSP